MGWLCFSIEGSIDAQADVIDWVTVFISTHPHAYSAHETV